MDGLVVARDHDGFVASLSRTSRSSLTGPQRDEMRTVCQQQDYDVKFLTVLDLMETRLGRQREPDTRWDAVVSRPVAARVGAATEQLIARMTDRFAKGLLTVRLLMTDRVLRRLLWEYVKDGHIRRHVRLAEVLAELLRLGILRHRMIPSASGFRVDVRYEPAEATLLFVSAMARPAQGRRPSMDESPLPKVGSVERIVWDHSGVAQSVLWARRRGTPLSVHLGPLGIYEFAAVGALIRRPAVGRALVTAVLGQDRAK